MTRYQVTHRTRFRYAAPVRFARCNTRLRPLDRWGQTVEAHALDVHPAATLSSPRDAGYLARATRILVDRSARELVVEARSRVAVARPTPMAHPGDLSVAEAAAAARAESGFAADAPTNYLYPSPLIGAFPEIAAWCAAELRPERGVVEAGLALARAIQAAFRYDGSATTLDTSPAAAFAARAGVCQDFAQVMVSGARSAGLAAAYVSGYLRTVPPPGRPRLVGVDASHAWAALWCGPARGWIGFDPTNGVAVGEDHVVAGVGRDYADVAPIDGIFLGQDGGEVEVAVDVEPLA